MNVKSIEYLLVIQGGKGFLLGDRWRDKGREVAGATKAVTQSKQRVRRERKGNGFIFADFAVHCELCDTAVASCL